MKQPQEAKYWKALGRFGVMVLLSLPWIAIVGFVDVGNSKWLKLLKFAFPFFMWNLTLTFLLDTICLKCGLYE